MKLHPNDPLIQDLKDVIFVVEATRFEQHALWQSYHPAVNWGQINSGRGFQIGTLADMPVVIGLTWAIIDGQRVMFVEATSQVVDYRMVEAWLEANCQPMWDQGHRIARCDTTNFHLCLHAIRDANKAAA